MCRIPAAVKDWEREAWAENYRRLDVMARELGQLFGIVDAIAARPEEEADATLTRVRSTAAQAVRLEMDLTGLRADRPEQGSLEDFFVHPELAQALRPAVAAGVILGDPDAAFAHFASRGSRVVVEGAPGAGKSTWTKWLQHQALSPAWTGLCVRIELRRMVGQALPSAHDVVRQAAGTHLAEELDARIVRRWFNRGQVLFLFDGFDEIPAGDREGLLGWIAEMGTAVRACPMLVTSRPLTTIHLQRLQDPGSPGTARWSPWTMLPFDEDRIEDYIQRWYRHSPVLVEHERHVDAAALAAAWRQDPTLKPLTGNPLLLSTLLMVHHLDGSLPSGRAQLYRRYVDGMLGIWDDRRKLRETGLAMTALQKRWILQGLGLRLFLNQREEMDEAETCDVVRSLLQVRGWELEACAVLEVLRERTGLLIGPGTYSFVHKSVAEYLVAEAVNEGDRHDDDQQRLDRMWLYEHRDDDRWNGVTFLWAGLATVAELVGFVEECLNAGAWELGYGLLYDQYERIGMDARRALILKSAEWVAPSLSRAPSWAWLPRGGPATSLPTIGLRSMGLDISLRHLQKRAVEEDALKWVDWRAASGRVRDSAWLVHAVLTDDLADWRQCLESEWPEEFRSLEGRCQIAEASFLRWMPEWDPLEVRVRTFLFACPEAIRIVALALMSVAVCGLLPTDDPTHVNPVQVKGMLHALDGMRVEDVDAGWLMASRSWQILGGSWEPFAGPVDLLEVFQTAMEELAESGKLERDKAFEGAVSFASRLSERRADLEEQQAAQADESDDSALDPESRCD